MRKTLYLVMLAMFFLADLSVKYGKMLLNGEIKIHFHVPKRPHSPAEYLIVSIRYDI